MSDLNTAIETLEAAGFTSGMKTPDGQFYHRDVNGDEEIAIHWSAPTEVVHRLG